MMYFNNLVGKTPLLKINDKLYAKLETYNPTGSVKDRTISYVVSEAIKRGEINSSSIFCDATSGNTGISLSAIAAALGNKCVIFMPKNMSEERKQMMKVFGAQIVDAPPDDFAMSIQMRDQFLDETKNAWSPKQFSNPDNIKCHKVQTAPEIHDQLKTLNLSWDVFIHGSGTGGTIEGIRQYILEEGINTKVCMTMPSTSPHGIQGIGDGRNFLANPDNMSDIIKIDTEDAISRAKDFAKSTGVLIGISSGANLLASEKYLQRNDVSGVIVTILCDRGERYMSIY
jgi:cysteine synthase A